LETTRPKPFVFVLMPFDEKFGDVYVLGIRQACADAGAYCERVDEQLFEESILDRIYNQIAKADLVIADMTGRNPNVFYEAGYAHALGKRVILLTQKSEDIPFDLKHYPHIIYEGRIAYLRSELERRVRWAIANPQDDLVAAELPIALSIRGVTIADDVQIPFYVEFVHNGMYAYHLQIDILNQSDIPLLTKELRIDVISPGLRVNRGDITRRTQAFPVAVLPDGRRAHRLRLYRDVYPGSWEPVVVDFDRQGVDWAASDRIPCSIRVASPLLHREYRFSLVELPRSGVGEQVGF
jgi:hypothetical protein